MTLKSSNFDKRLPNALLAFIVATILTIQPFVVTGSALALSDLPEQSLKKPPMVREFSVSCYVPSEAAPGKGLAVNLIYSKLPRYADGAPVAVIAPGGSGADGLGFEMHAAQVGFIEVRFAFPGGSHGSFASSGIYDNRGPESQKAFRDVCLFAAGKLPNSEGQKIYEMLPCKVSTTNVGIVGWSNGGNIALVTLYKYAEELQFIGWIAFYESPLGSMFFPPNLGGEHDLVANKHYRQGSCATGDCLLDYKHLEFDPFLQRNAGERKKNGEIEIPGVLYFDENKNNRWDESLEYAFSYATDVGLEKQIYPPDLTAALELAQTFIHQVNIAPKKLRSGPPVPTGFVGIFDKGDPSNPPIDPLATPRKIPSVSATEATDKWAYSFGVPPGPISARNRKYYFRPLPPNFKEDENGQLIDLEQEALKKANEEKENAEIKAKEKRKQAKQKRALALSGAPTGDVEEALSNDSKGDAKNNNAKDEKDEIPSLTKPRVKNTGTAGGGAVKATPGADDSVDADELALRGMKRQSKLAIERVRNDHSKIDKGAMTDESDIVDPYAETSQNVQTADSVDQSEKIEKTEMNTAADSSDNAADEATDTPAKTKESAAVSAPKANAVTATGKAAEKPKPALTVKAPKAVGGPSLRQKIRFGSLPKKRPREDFDHFMLVWPDSIATLKESEAYYEERDGSLYIAKIIEKFPNLLVMVFGSEVDHLQRQPDHPHIALNYNAWLSNKARFVRLNPDQFYMAAVAGMNKGNFRNNPPRSPIDASEMLTFLESEGVVPDYVYMQGSIAELADRKRTKNLRGNLTDVLIPYDNGAAPPPVPLKKKAAQ